MENASKALLMAATVLVGVLLLSLGTYLFTIFSNFSADTTLKMNQKNIDEFNAQFYKYKSYKDESGNWQNKCRAQDIVSIANIAKENNIKYDYTVADENSGSYYIKVIIKQGMHTISHFEAESIDSYKDFLRDYSGEKVLDANGEVISYKIKYFICTDVQIRPDNKRVCSITFEEYKN